MDNDFEFKKIIVDFFNKILLSFVKLKLFKQCIFLNFSVFFLLSNIRIFFKRFVLINFSTGKFL